MGPQRKLGIYIGYDSPSIVRYLEIQTGDVFKARFADCHFNESKFPILGRENKLPEKELNWNASSLMHLDPRSGQCELEVQKIIHLQRIANELPDAFSDTKRITKSYIPAENVPIRIDVQVGQIATEANTRQKPGRLVSSKDKNPRKRKEVNNIPVEKDIVETPAVVKNSDIVLTPEDVQVLENCENDEISINYVLTGEKWDRNKTIVNEIFAYNVALNIMHESKDLEPRSVEECRQRNDWPKWK
ncbi:Copia-like polyprotein [Arachis hypogaea]|nr:Copia-like polyprotein [Arachis hypogaea]